MISTPGRAAIVQGFVPHGLYPRRLIFIEKSLTK